MPIVTLPNFLVVLISSPFVVFLCQWLKQEHWSTAVKTLLLAAVSGIVALVTLVVEYHSGIATPADAIALFSTRGLEVFALAHMLYLALSGRVIGTAPASVENPALASAKPTTLGQGSAGVQRPPSPGAPSAEVSPGSPPPPGTNPSA